MCLKAPFQESVGDGFGLEVEQLVKRIGLLLGVGPVLEDEKLGERIAFLIVERGCIGLVESYWECQGLQRQCSSSVDLEKVEEG